MSEVTHLEGVEARASIEDPQVPISNRKLLEIFGLDALSDTGIRVDYDSALGVPAIWCAVNFISATTAAMPLGTYRKRKDSREKLNTRLANMLRYNVNAETTSFAWRKQVFERVLTRGRSYTLIVRGEREPIRYLWPLETANVTPKRLADGKRVYEVESEGKKRVYPAKDIIDMSFMLAENGVDHKSPILTNKQSIGLGIAATRYGSRFFQNGGVPPFALVGNFQSAGALDRASNDLAKAVKAAVKDSRQALTLPREHDLKHLGVDPEKLQMVGLHKFLIEEYARIYQLPPAFLQDLTNGTYSNTEQQDLHFVKHTLTRWLTQFEQELNLKLFGWDRHDRYVEFNVDGILRGDFKTRMEGYGHGIQNAILKPNEARKRENLPDDPKGNELLIQGATVPVGSQPTNEANQNEA